MVLLLVLLVLLLGHYHPWMALLVLPQMALQEPRQWPMAEWNLPCRAEVLLLLQPTWPAGVHCPPVAAVSSG